MPPRMSQIGSSDVFKLAWAGSEVFLLLTTDKVHRGFSCLQVAAHNGRLAVVQHLAGLLGGRLLRLRGADGATALDLAAAGGHGAVCNALLAAASTWRAA